jgi:hypothetical protein
MLKSVELKAFRQVGDEPLFILQTTLHSMLKSVELKAFRQVGDDWQGVRHYQVQCPDSQQWLCCKSVLNDGRGGNLRQEVFWVPLTYPRLLQAFDHPTEHASIDGTSRFFSSKLLSDLWAIVTTYLRFPFALLSECGSSRQFVKARGQVVYEDDGPLRMVRTRLCCLNEDVLWTLLDKSSFFRQSGLSCCL